MFYTKTPVLKIITNYRRFYTINNLGHKYRRPNILPGSEKWVEIDTEEVDNLGKQNAIRYLQEINPQSKKWVHSKKKVVESEENESSDKTSLSNESNSEYNTETRVKIVLSETKWAKPSKSENESVLDLFSDVNWDKKEKKKNSSTRNSIGSWAGAKSLDRNGQAKNHSRNNNGARLDTLNGPLNDDQNRSGGIFDRLFEGRSNTQSWKMSSSRLSDARNFDKGKSSPAFFSRPTPKRQPLPSLGKSKELLSKMEMQSDFIEIGESQGLGKDVHDVIRLRQKFGPKKEKAVTFTELRKTKPIRKDHERRMEEDDEFDIDIDVERPKKKQQILVKPQEIQKEIFLPEAISISNLAKLIGERMASFEHKLRSLGIEYTSHDHLLNSEEASLIAMEYNLNPVVNTVASLDIYSKPKPADMSKHPFRPPIVTIMGHVDHGKTTLLDSLRRSSVAAGEVGGITQHIGAFSVSLPSKKTITFLDTPGHAAFSAMRARGAHVTDIIVLVVAADDGVMPQTLEAIKHAQDAGVPMVVAINKIDKHDANVVCVLAVQIKVRQLLMSNGVELEEYGGDTQCVEISALMGEGLEKLEEAIITLAELSEYRAEIDIEAEGNVIESQVEKGKGNVATVLVKRGTLKQGDIIVAGTSWCKVRLMTDDKGQSLRQALPGTPVKVVGWKDLPKAGDEVLQAKDEEIAKTVVNNRKLREEREKQLKDLEVINEKRRQRKQELEVEQANARNFKKEVWMFHKGLLKEYPTISPPSEDNVKVEEDSTKELRVVIKADVSGSVEAVVNSLDSLGNDEVTINLIDFGVGDINESDIMKASASKSLIYGFNVKVNPKASALATAEHVDIATHNIIYKLLDDAKDRLSKMLPPTLETQVTGEATVLKIFEINVRGKEFRPVAGCRITTGTVTKTQKARVLRGEKQIWEGSIESLKQVKKDIPEAKKGTECGIMFDGFTDLKEGDTIQTTVIKETPRTL
ncbi:14249_t:CDS:10 [Acaulospora morrowiae]|uniref:Translation initiation factor IF-2, mitochondrial n=1 Tax=Acaulospora morrowiae TaxID=94023 RepID=A0A9N8ZQY0_9GLOM|nr:14249_t:CDS:10 [Acaulospora morrowiae]